MVNQNRKESSSAMNKIIQLKEQDGVPVVSSREIAERFGKENKHVNEAIKKLTVESSTVKKMIFENTYISNRGRNENEYLLTRDGFTLVAMGFSGKEALKWKLKYIDAFNKMENVLKEQSRALPTTYKEALIQLLDQVEKNEQLEAERVELLPKRDYHDKVLNKNDLLTTTIVAKDLGFASATKLNVVMFENRIIFKNANSVWTPYAKYEWLIKDGYADYRSYTQDNAKPSLQWTEKGRKWIVENYKDWCSKVA